MRIEKRRKVFVGAAAESIVCLVQYNDGRCAMLHERMQFVKRKAVARRVVGGGDEDHLGMVAIILIDHFLHVVLESPVVLVHRVVGFTSEHLLGHRFVVPPGLVREQDCLIAMEVTVYDLFQHIFAAVAQENLFFRKPGVVTQTFGQIALLA